MTNKVELKAIYSCDPSNSSLDQENARKNLINTIEQEGIFLGEGAFGKTYLYDNGTDEFRVYKIPKVGLTKVEEAMSNPKRIVRLWNDFYTRAYGGKFVAYASARICECKILSTPYIRGEKLNPLNTKDDHILSAFNSILSKKFHRRLVDFGRYGNVLNIGHEDENLVIVDFDLYIPTDGYDSDDADAIDLYEKKQQAIALSRAYEGDESAFTYNSDYSTEGVNPETIPLLFGSFKELAAIPVAWPVDPLRKESQEKLIRSLPRAAAVL